MSYPFYCPQGHELHAELTAIGQTAQCPVCGAGFVVPPPDYGAVTTRNAERLPGLWTSGAANLPVAMAVDPQPVPERSESPQEASPAETAPPMPPPPGDFLPQSIPQEVFGLLGRVPAQRPTIAIAEPGPPAHAPAGTEDMPDFALGFDPRSKAALPIDLPGQGAAEASEPSAASSTESPGSFLAGPAPVDPLYTSAFAEASSPPVREKLAGPPPKTLHIRCPTGHIVMAPSELLGRLGRCPACKKTFELRYENSLEFQRRTERIVRGKQDDANRAWLGWTFAVIFFTFVALAGAVILMSR